MDVDIEDLDAPHRFGADDAQAIQTQLLAWYDANKRDLPWRKPVLAAALAAASNVAATATVDPVDAQPERNKFQDESRLLDQPNRLIPNLAAALALPPETLVHRYSDADVGPGQSDESQPESGLSDLDDDDDDEESASRLQSRRRTVRSAAVSPNSSIPSVPAGIAESPGQRAYEVWVSEIMCQQTQVATVIPYYQRWMAKWPTIFDLAKTDLEEVNQVWAGLGYYSRAKRLHEAAKLVVTKFGGDLPRTAEALEKEVPGVGRYTAGAIASLAYQQPAPLVDGNVIRVLSRLRALGGDVKTKSVTELHWTLATELVHPDRPGDLNQSLMELGALVCTPANPSCATCPVQTQCWAYHAKRADCKCVHCKTWSGTPGKDASVTQYPRKAIKKPPREETIHVALVQAGDKFLLTQRPKKGLLAGLWEFPSRPELGYAQAAVDAVGQILDVDDTATAALKLMSLGTVVHLFSHIRQTMEVYHVVVPTDLDPVDTADACTAFLDAPAQWVTKDGLDQEAVSTGMKKAFALLGKASKKTKATRSAAPARANKRAKVAPDPTQKSISSFFKKE
ncbi:A/G-specific adenine glycosylase [Allomyces macrogynus ATCC 38327]|uniref:Adenine DNA glycosylase n=1 Tax=Allomyces macrogynus (strain ATCC 38327) TaxID=578462 RepID=A0A0L0S9S4_ALLM3|nr:A/G-specific adenine glycosylase [Allomyces macrogynus ATCC 38327]|eukprot:KNE59139.1 A/G-specific adenine glycosylase [Allomyces macrogynus ATCC 38327]